MLLKYKITPVITLLLTVVVMISCNNRTDEFEVKGKLKNLSGGHFYAVREQGDSTIVDTVKIEKGGEFAFSGSVDTLTVVNLYFNQNTQNTYILVDKGLKVEIDGDALLPDLISVKGGEANDNLTLFKDQNKNLLRDRARILESAESRINNKGKDSTAVKDYVVELKNINFELSNTAFAYVKANPDKISSVLLISTFFKDESTISRLSESLDMLKGKAADFSLTSDLKNYRDKVRNSQVGASAPNFMIKNNHGKEVDLMRDYREKYVLLSFSSTTCDVCKSERKEDLAVYNQLKKEKKNIEFISIIKDVEEIPLQKELTDSVKWTILPVYGGWSAKLFELYYIKEIPYNILISPSGIIIDRDIPLSALSSRIEALTKKK